MNVRLKLLALVSAVSFFATSLAKADTLVYDNGPIDGTIEGRTINNGYSVSNSFTVSGDTALTWASIGLWATGNPLSVSWSIGTTFFGSEISNGISALSSSYLGDAYGYYSVYESTFSLNGALSSGTYYFTLSDATASNQGYVYWDRNNGPSVAQQTSVGELPGSNAFKLYSGDGSSVPDSGATVALLGGALLSLAAFRRRQAA